VLIGFFKNTVARQKITLRIPIDVVQSLKEIAPQKGFSGYQALLKSYLSEGLRHDESQFIFGKTARLIEALRKRGVSAEVLLQAEKEVATQV
jgi:hypothetical protein